MRIQAPKDHPVFSTRDIYNKSLDLADYRGKKVLLSFFREANCPFCNLRVHELTHRYPAWKKQGFEVIAVFCSQEAQVRDYNTREPRPFRLVADPQLAIYNRFGVERSNWAFFKSILLKLPHMMRGMVAGGRPRMNAHMTLIPADFLINENGKIVESWYGRDARDHIPLERINAFIDTRLPSTGAP